MGKDSFYGKILIYIIRGTYRLSEFEALYEEWARLDYSVAALTLDVSWHRVVYGKRSPILSIKFLRITDTHYSRRTQVIPLTTKFNCILDYMIQVSV